MTKRFFTLLLIFLSSQSLSSENSIWGTIVSPKQQIAGVQYKYFAYFEENGQIQAYPIETSDKKLNDLIIKNLDQKVRIRGTVKEVLLNIDGPQKKILVFTPNTIEPLSLSELAINDANPPSPERPVSYAKKEKVYEGGGIRISDKAANTIIYTGAAVILGTQLGKALFKKK